MGSGVVVAALGASAGEIGGSPSNAIVAEHSNKCLTAGRSGGLVQRTCSQAEAMRQSFRITPINGGYTIALLAGGCLGLPEGQAPQLEAACDSAAELNLTLLMAQEDKYAISGDQSGLCLDVAGGSTAEGAPVTAADCDNGESQAWQVTPSPSVAVPTVPSAVPSVPVPSTSPSTTPPSATPSATPPSATPSATPPSVTPSPSRSSVTPSATPNASPSGSPSATPNASPSAAYPAAGSSTTSIKVARVMPHAGS